MKYEMIVAGPAFFFATDAVTTNTPAPRMIPVFSRDMEQESASQPWSGERMCNESLSLSLSLSHLAVHILWCPYV